MSEGRPTTEEERVARLVQEYATAYSQHSSDRDGDFLKVGTTHIALMAAIGALAKEALRYRWLRQYLHVGADAPGDWTCWLILDCIPFRSQTDSAEELLDELMKRFPLDAAIAASGGAP